MEQQMNLKINLNADLGESFGIWKINNEENLTQIVNSANIACGKHAGDENIMKKVVLKCIKNNVSIGAHPGFSDLQGFGRRRINLTLNEIENLISYQLGSLIGITQSSGGKVTHIKPHGALNNMSCESPNIARSIINGFKYIDKNLILLAPVNSFLFKEGIKSGINTISEGFADRTYMSNGNLSPRTAQGSIITDLDKCIKQSLALAKGEPIRTLDGKEIILKVQSICIHGDNDESIEQSKEIRNTLLNNRFKLINLPDI